jgi:hypothetical protein
MNVQIVRYLSAIRENTREHERTRENTREHEMGAVLSTPPPSAVEEEVLLGPEVEQEEELPRAEIPRAEIPGVEREEKIPGPNEHFCQYRPPYSQRKCTSKLTSEWIEKSRKMLEEDQSPYVDVCVRHLRFYVRTRKVRLQDREERLKYLQEEAVRVKERKNLQKQDEKVCQKRHGMLASEYRFLSSFLQRCLEGKGLLLPDGRTVKVSVEVIENEEDPEIVENEGV